MVDCDEVALRLAHGGRLPVGDGELVAHLAECEACAELTREQRMRDLRLELGAVDPARFELGEEIAIGGMGRITRAFDRRLGREVALKEMLGPELRARFEREAAITARLQHPAIVPVYEAGIWPDGNAFYTMRLVSGGTLADAIARRPTLAARLELLPNVTAVTAAVAYAHSCGIIHRDLKPQNILIGELGETVVIDWGLAKAADDDGLVAGADGDPSPAHPSLTRAGTVVGTPCFLSPEQARGADLDARADVFALGAILYDLLAGSPPYWDQTHDADALVAAVAKRAPTPIATLAPETPPDLRAIVDRAMARDPAARYPDAHALADELRRFAAGQLLVSRRYRFGELASRWVRRHRAVVASVGLAALALVGIGVFASGRVTRARAAETAQRTIAERAYEIGERRGQRKLCASSSPLLASPWDAVSRDRVHRGFDRLGLAYVPLTLQRIDQAFDRWTADLAAAREAECGAAGDDQPQEQLAARLECLGERVREARALVSRFEDVDGPTALAAATAAERLAPVARCAETVPARTVLAPTPAVEHVRDTFAATNALMVLDRFREALPLARTVVIDADATGIPGLRAAARVALGAALVGTSDLDGATPVLRDALRLAEGAHDDRSRAQAWTNLVRIEFWRGHYEEALALQAPALGAAERIDDINLQTQIMLDLGGALSQLGRYTDAEALFADAVRMLRQSYGDHDWRLAFALSALGNAYAMRGDLERGIAAHRESTAIGEAVLGPAHPDVGVMHGNLASDYLYALRASEAVTELTSELAAVEGAYGPKHRTVAMTLTDLGDAQEELGHHADALVTFARAEASWQLVNPKHPGRAEVLSGRYAAATALGQPARVADLEEALVLAKGLPPFIRARIELALGKVTPGRRGIELVTTSVKDFATSTLPLVVREQRAAEAWLAQRNVRR